MMNIDYCRKKGLSPAARANLSATWTGIIHWDVSMSDYCTFRAGGRAEALLVPSTLAELATLMRWLRQNRVSWRVIGRGSNILVQSGGFDGVMIVLGGDFCTVAGLDDYPEGKEGIRVRVGTGCSVARVLGWCSRRSFSGLEFMVGIPGSMGGAVRMNAGAWGREIGDVVKSVSLIDAEGQIHVLSGNELMFSYRQLVFRETALQDAIMVEVVLQLTPGRQKDIIAACRRYAEKRRAKQPQGMASAGSFFKNPPENSAGRLIDDAGLKGCRKGGAMVSPKHANFILNTGQATADDIVELMKEVQQKVYLRSGVLLEPEVHLL